MNNEEWVKAGSANQAAWCYYGNNPENGKKYGKLYNWFAVNDKRGIAPDGWHAASDSEWSVLISTLGGEKNAPTKMKSISGWEDSSNGTNINGFSAFPSGYRNFNGAFGYSVTVTRDIDKKQVGFSVRCIKD